MISEFFSIIEYSMLISFLPLIMNNPMFFSNLHPPLFEEERGNEGVS